MARQWLRQCRLTIGDGSSATVVSGVADQAGNLTEGLRIRFSVRKADLQAPGQAEITITNLSDETANKIQKEYTRIVLEVGYPENLATVFEGEIVQKRKGRENQTDTYLTILAKEGQQAYSHAVVNKTLAAGHTFKDQVDACLEVMKPFGITAGYIADLGTMKMPRGRAMFGMARDQLRAICASTATSWSIQGKKLQIVKNDGALPGAAVVLNSNTGMIGMPTQTMGGIEVRCLINPDIKVGGLVKIDQASIQLQQLTLTQQDQTGAVQQALMPTTDADGLYRVFDIAGHGDTRGTDWYMDLICVAKSGSIIPKALSDRGLVGVPFGGQ